jgi:hypothetical protein
LVDELTTKVATDDRSDWLNAPLETRRYKVIDAIVNIDMQDPPPRSSRPRRIPKDGMRDFSPETMRP